MTSRCAPNSGFMAHPTIQPPPEPTLIDAAASRVGTPLNASWILNEVLGIGGMAAVFSGTHVSGRRAALKVLHAALGQDPTTRARFLQEGKLSNQIEHAGRVRVLDEGVSARGEPFLVMELLVGTTLRRLLRRPGDTLPLEQALAVFDAVLDLLECCHALGIVHRDIKPANVFITADGEVKVLDFGLAQQGEADRRLTRVGLTYGTPAFMAPEQAMGLGTVDGRADLWSVGASLYVTLSGQPLRKGRTEAEAYLLAATQPAPSLAPAAPRLPVEVVAFVDRALAFDRSRRFQTATAMRAELRGLLAANAAGRLTPGTPVRGPGVIVRTNDVFSDAEGGPLREGQPSREETMQRVASAWKQLAAVLGSARQYGFSHPYVARGLAAVLEEITRMLAEDPTGMRWDVAPGAFLVGGQPVWQPDRAPFDRIPFQLFADGIRHIQLKPGLTDLELRDFAAILLRDRAFGSDEDSITALWDRRFEHIAYLAVDSFMEGDPQAVDEASLDLCLNLARIDRLWNEDSLEGRVMQRNMEASLRDGPATASPGMPGRALAFGAVDRMTLGTLGAQISPPFEQWRDRFLDAFVDAYLEAARRGDAPSLLAALSEWTQDQIALHNLALAFEVHAALRRAFSVRAEGRHDGLPGSLPGVHRALTASMFPPTALRAVFEELTTYGPDEPAAGDDAAYGRQAAGLPPPPPPVAAGVAEGLGLALEALPDGSLFLAACDAYGRVQSDRVREVLLGFLHRWLPGREAELAEILPRAPEAHALTILRLLSSLRTPEATAALEAALGNPHLEVRVSALALLPDPARDTRDTRDTRDSRIDPRDLRDPRDPRDSRDLRDTEAAANPARTTGSGDRIREELQRLLDEPQTAARLEALRTIARLSLLAAGPTLVRHIQATSFHDRSVEERREWLETVVRLNPARAERLAIELLEKRHLLPSEALEQTREIAAQVLATFASSEEALTAVKEATKPRWGSNPAVRDAAARAVPSIAARHSRRRSAELASEGSSPLSRRASTMPPPPSAPPPGSGRNNSSLRPPPSGRKP